MNTRSDGAEGLLRQEPWPRLFLLPGGMGGLFDLVRLSRALTGQVETTVLMYPPVDFATLAPVDYQAVVADILGKIRAQAGDRPFGLLGYSFGGFVAFDAARLLAAEGKRIAFLGVIDTTPMSLSKMDEKVPGYLARVLARESLITRLSRTLKAGLSLKLDINQMLGQLVEHQLAHRHYGTVRWLWRMFKRFNMQKAGVLLQNSAALNLRGNAASEGFKGGYYAGHMTVFKADDPEWNWYGETEGLGWKGMCARIDVENIPGPHLQVFEPQNIGPLKDAVIAALARHRSVATANP